MKPTQEQLEFGIETLLFTLAVHNPDTAWHSKRVSRIALDLGRALKLKPEQLYALKLGSLLHDLGKLQTPKEVLSKTSDLDPEEWEVMRRHPANGANMLRLLGFPEAICLMVEQHHERYDGKGYPFGLRGRKIKLESQIIAIADTFDAITSDRSYRSGQSAAIAVDEIRSGSGKQFDSKVTAVFVNLHRSAQLAA
jgi:putative nucleotidyltransferase with HDIG domain